jgi:hypothetical protein
VQIGDFKFINHGSGPPGKKASPNEDGKLKDRSMPPQKAPAWVRPVASACWARPPGSWCCWQGNAGSTSHAHSLSCCWDFKPRGLENIENVTISEHYHLFIATAASPRFKSQPRPCLRTLAVQAPSPAGHHPRGFGFAAVHEVLEQAVRGWPAPRQAVKSCMVDCTRRNS